MASADQISCRNLGRQSWSSAPTERRASHINHPGQRRTAERLRQRVRGNGWELRQRSSPRGHQLGTIPQSRRSRASSLYTREPLGTGDTDCRVGPAGLLAMTTVFCHSEASAHTGRGNPSFLRWTGSGRRVVGPYGTKQKPAATARAALSEAESAKREAGQIQVLPDTFRVQHGVPCPEVSAKPRPCSRKVYSEGVERFSAASRCAAGRVPRP